MELTQAYRLYTLALADKPVLSAMNKLRSYTNLSSVAKWRLAAAYTLIGRKDVANDLVFGTSKNINPYIGTSYTYGGKTRDEALILETLALMQEHEEGKELLDNIAKKLASGDYMNTQSTAYSLLAISKFVGENGNAKSFNFDLKINGKTSSISSNSSYKQIDINVEKTPSGNLEVNNTTNTRLFASIQMQGIPMYDGVSINEDNKIRMSVQYFNMDATPLNPSKIEQGSDFYVETSITNTDIIADYENLALTQIFPSGWEIRNTRMDLHQTTKKDNITYQDIRERKNRGLLYEGFPFQGSNTRRKRGFSQIHTSSL
mgnify:CR=1 FL=1